MIIEFVQTSYFRLSKMSKERKILLFLSNVMCGVNDVYVCVCEMC